MKKLLLLTIFILSAAFNASSQELKYSELTEAKKGKFTSYISKGGDVYKVGDKVKIGFPSSDKTFSFITQGDGVLLGITPLAATSSGQETEIKSIAIAGTKRTGYYAMFRTKGLTALVNYGIQIENAIETGEVKSFGMSSDDALAALKKAKDKLDLGLISQEEYDKQKAELSKFIK